LVTRGALCVLDVDDFHCDVVYGFDD
jgi:hypothetical protein